MLRNEIEEDIRRVLGSVPSLFERVPDEFLPAEWELTKRLQLGGTLIPNRHKDLISLAVAAAVRCPYGLIIHRELGRIHGVTEAEMAEAVHLTRVVCGLGVQLAGLEIDVPTFAAEVQKMTAYMAGNERGVQT
ncbi:MAG: carboxymuconolactone decarboxylase family protein [Acidimicrobiia bacterium]